MDEPHLYQYQFVADGPAFTARAVGDLDCDRVTSLFERAGWLTNEGTVRGSRGMHRERSTE